MSAHCSHWHKHHTKTTWNHRHTTIFPYNFGLWEPFVYVTMVASVLVNILSTLEHYSIAILFVKRKSFFFFIQTKTKRNASNDHIKMWNKNKTEIVSGAQNGQRWLNLVCRQSSSCVRFTRRLCHHFHLGRCYYFLTGQG